MKGVRKNIQKGLASQSLLAWNRRDSSGVAGASALGAAPAALPSLFLGSGSALISASAFSAASAIGPAEGGARDGGAGEGGPTTRGGASAPEAIASRAN